VVARFSKVATQASLVIEIVGSGEVYSESPYISCSRAACDLDFPANTALTLAARPAPGWRFQGFSGACSGLDCSVVTPAQVTATFSRIERTVLIDFADTGSGTVTLSDGQKCTESCRLTLGEGPVSLRADAEPDYSSFVGFGGDCAGTTCLLDGSRTESRVVASFRSVLVWHRSFPITGAAATPSSVNVGAAILADDAGILISRSLAGSLALILDGGLIRSPPTLQSWAFILDLDWDGGMRGVNGLIASDGGSAANELHALSRDENGTAWAVGACRGHAGFVTAEPCSPSIAVRWPLRVRYSAGGQAILRAEPDTLSDAVDLFVLHGPSDELLVGSQRRDGTSSRLVTRFSRLTDTTLQVVSQADIERALLGSGRGASACVADEARLICTLDGHGDPVPGSCDRDAGPGSNSGNTMVVSVDPISLDCIAGAVATGVASGGGNVWPGGLTLSRAAPQAPLLLAGQSVGAAQFGTAGVAGNSGPWLAQLDSTAEFTRVAWWPSPQGVTDGQQLIMALPVGGKAAVLGATMGNTVVLDRPSAGAGVYLLVLRDDWSTSEYFWFVRSDPLETPDLQARVASWGDRVVVTLVARNASLGGRSLDADGQLRLHVLVFVSVRPIAP
jgi:hypothetical protein